ncbi:hypothetical protein BH20ACI4_BH20ACI4_10440 [soil metagenome]
MKQSLQTRDLRHFRGGDLRMCEVLYPATLRQPRHTHKFASFSFVLRGNYAETVNSRTHSRQPSTVIFHPPEESHTVIFENDVRIFSVEFDFERLSRLKQHFVVFDDSTSCRSEETNFLGNKIYREFCRMDSFSMLAIEGLILELLAEASRSKFGNKEKNIPLWLNRTKDFLHENFTESLTLEELARRADVHPVYLSRIFREKFDCTVGEYVRRLRVEFASRQISTTENPLSEIALLAGFADQSHLTRTFKSAYGLTPAEYRKLRRLN